MKVIQFVSVEKCSEKKTLLCVINMINISLKMSYIVGYELTKPYSFEI